MENSQRFINLVCSYTRITEEKIKSKSRKRKVCEARQLASYILSLHTRLSLFKIAEKLNYFSHASVWRDKREVPNLFDVDKKFAADYMPLLHAAKILAKELSMKEMKELFNKPLLSGDICWFWNENALTRFPRIGTFERSYLNEDKEQIFVTRECPAFTYSHCTYAGEEILPERFRARSGYIASSSLAVTEREVFEIPFC